LIESRVKINKRDSVRNHFSYNSEKQSSSKIGPASLGFLIVEFDLDRRMILTLRDKNQRSFF